MEGMGRTLIIIGALLLVIGLLVTFAPKVPFLGKLPGDILIKRDNFVFYIPITTSILLSIITSIVLYILNK